MFELAAQRNEVNGSPSGMFWDDITSLGRFDSTVGWRNGRLQGDHWLVEPALQAVVGRSRDSATATGMRLDLLSNLQLGKLTVRTVVDIDQAYRELPVNRFPWLRREDAPAARMQEAFIQYRTDHLLARIGRLNRCWGPFADRSLLISDNPFSYDALEVGLFNRFLEFRHLFAALPFASSWSDAGGSYFSRYLTAHSLNVTLGEWAVVGVSESVIFANNRGRPDLSYVNPAMVYFVTNTHGESAGNLMLGVHCKAHPGIKSLTFRGQLLIDDLQVDNETIRDQEPNHWAMDASLTWTDPLPVRLAHHFQADYRYLSRWVYTVADLNFRSAERYSYLNRSLGHPWIDGDQFGLQACVTGTDFWSAVLGWRLNRQGANTIDSLWHDNGTFSLHYRHETPLRERTDVTRTVSIHAAGLGYFRDYATLRLELDNRWQSQGAGRWRYDPRFSLSLNAHFSGLLLTPKATHK